MSQGTRTQQLAQYVIYDSPLQYLRHAVRLSRRARVLPLPRRHPDHVSGAWNSNCCAPVQAEVFRKLTQRRENPAGVHCSGLRQ
jgi:hypothetical protein